MESVVDIVRSLGRSGWGCVRLSRNALVCLCVLAAGCALLDKPEPEPAPAPAPTPVSPALPPLPELSAREHTQQAIALLEVGQWELAQRHLERSLELEPNRRRSAHLLEQLLADPQEYLGSRSFTYTIKRGETLSKVAQGQLGDSLKFPILARYNGIVNPSALRAGERIQVPGKAPKKEAITPPVETTPVLEPVVDTTTPEVNAADLLDQANEAQASNDLERAFEFAQQAAALEPNNVTAQDAMLRLRGELLSQYSDEAYGLEENGDVASAVGMWKKVLALDPNDVAAQLNLARLQAN